MSLYHHESTPTQVEADALRPARKTWQQPVLSIDALRDTAVGAFSNADGNIAS
ncbi:hypothetical protein PJ900_01725 (plasmid) [Tistrella mobilis]|uniref:hypothetical protein n=1 Tax=Tistrella mobilis TaxID=171437 RepID=UPI0018D40715|nr:hypothetical protein [Tistrella mobilis]